jgi:hypothetical protein
MKSELFDQKRKRCFEIFARRYEIHPRMNISDSDRPSEKVEKCFASMPLRYLPNQGEVWVVTVGGS